ncbi:hypothetical protein HY734_01980 [Candidatus Uhrbacteria bacterium]|nr:hypothetical protein [Candidatus Uhrbacteria bacterium]
MAWYEGQERVLTPEFLKAIPWQDVAQHPLSERFIPVLLYMRDVENFTSIYFDYLRRTPTGRDPVIRRFMVRKFWEPVGQGTKRVTARIQQLPGFEGFRRMTERVAEIATA